MRRLLSVAALALMLLPARAAEEAKPNTLTSKEIADGWLLLFDGESPFGWKIEGDATVKDGVLILGGDKETTATLSTGFSDYRLHFQYTGTGAKGVKFLPFAGKDSGFPLMVEAENRWLEVDYSLSKRDGLSGSFGEKGKPGAAFGSKPDKEPLYPALRSAVKLHIPKGVRLGLRDIKLQPLALGPIFNGKDLAGWKEHPGKKSKCGVNDQGEITMKDGPGDLQTEGQWDDFVLQIECKTNGKHLNSGVFFRCRPNEYQQGYEAQIHNGFAAEPNKEYTIETYDPETGKVLTAKKEKYAALDYGTGAIYRRMPARKQAAKDGEWFTMIVIAEGRHLATWVNGVQMVDWTDTRPVKDNARNGCKLEKGPISLQGHDPTTDLNFRNIRIAELPKAEKK
jgi:hypothetical protein